MRQRMAAVLALALAACGRSEGEGGAAKAGPGETRPARGAAGGVSRADGAGGPRVVPLRPMTGDVEILYGNPDSAGQAFAMRIRELPGNIIPPHAHPVDEHVTVVRGTWYYGFGDRWDSTALNRLETGSYAFAPAGTMMYGWSPDSAVVQVHGVGPFHIHWRDGLTLLDEPGGEALFRYRKGDAVTTPRGRGTIRQGYASGTLIQYEITGPGGALFMAREEETSRAP